MIASIHQTTRRPLSEHSQAIGKQMLFIRLYQESTGFLCERELIETDGTGVFQILPFQKLSEVQEFLVSDPHYLVIKRGASKILDSLALEIPNESACSKTQ